MSYAEVDDQEAAYNGESQHSYASYVSYGSYASTGSSSSNDSRMIKMGRFLEQWDDQRFVWDKDGWEADPRWLDPVSAAGLDPCKHKVFAHNNKEYLRPPSPLTMTKKLGESGGTVVYRVLYNSSYRRPLALKVIPCSDGTNPLGPANPARASALREVQNMKGVRHPHIVVYVASFENYCMDNKKQIHYRRGRPRHSTRLVIADHNLCIAMYPPASHNLRTYMADIFRDSDPGWNEWKLRSMHSFFGCLAQAVTYLHGSQVKIRHKDIKPENVVIDDFGNPMLTDFGISVQGVGTSSGHTAKTVKYAPPEANHEDGRRDRRSDVFSLGCVYLEMATVLLGNQPTYPERRLEELMTAGPFKYSDVLPGLSAYIERLSREAELLRSKEPHRDASINAVLSVLPHIERMMAEELDLRPQAGTLYPCFEHLCDVYGNRCRYCENERAQYAPEPDSQRAPTLNSPAVPRSPLNGHNGRKGSSNGYFDIVMGGT